MRIIRKIKRYLPDSIFARFLLIFTIPIFFAQGITIYMFYERHWDNVSDKMSQALAGELALVVDGIEQSSSENLNNNIARFGQALDFSIILIGKDLKLDNLRNNPKSHNHQLIRKYLNNKIKYPYTIYRTDDGNNIVVDVKTNKHIIHISFTNKRLTNPTTYIFIMWMTGTAIILIFISLIFMRNQIRPIIRLANAAYKFGKGQEINSFKPEGAREIRKASIAFLEMKERIDRQVSQRTEMLAGVSHDLRTPLTRMKLQLALMPENKQKLGIENDINEMKAMISAYLDFSKKANITDIESVNIVQTINHIIQNHPNKQVSISLETKNDINLSISKSCFSRIISNIIDNAARYSSVIKIKIKTEAKDLLIIVDDNGPGIPKDKRKDVFKPFYRLDTSRNRETGGVGLGLAITRDLVSRYGGEINLEDNPDGAGLRVVISLPI